MMTETGRKALPKDAHTNNNKPSKQSVRFHFPSSKQDLGATSRRDGKKRNINRDRKWRMPQVESDGLPLVPSSKVTLPRQQATATLLSDTLATKTHPVVIIDSHKRELHPRFSANNQEAWNNSMAFAIQHCKNHYSPSTWKKVCS